MKRRNPPPLPEGTREQLQAAFKVVRTKEQYRRLLCLWLRAALRMTSKEIAFATGLTPSAVRRVQRRFYREGVDMFRRPGRGGRHRQHLSIEAERRFLERLLRETQPANALLQARFIQEEFEKMVGRAVTSSVVYRMLRRHNWRRLITGRVATPHGWAAAKLPL